MEQTLIHLLQEHGYIILFFWSVLEGELGLIMAGILAHTGHMNLPAAIFVAGLGGFTGDQIYFSIGRYAKKYIHKKMHKHKRKFAIAHLLLKKYGWPIIFIQRYMYGLRTVIPMSIGLTRYPAGKFALINLFSAWTWATITILPAYLLGEQILTLLKIAKAHWYFALPLIALFLGGLFMISKKIEKNLAQRGKQI